MRLSTTVTVLIASLANVHAFWRLECKGSTGLARLDPLMNYGTVGDHIHSIKGGSAFSATSTSEDLLNSNCTSCGVAEDMSAYWIPAMYFMHDNGQFEVVPEKPPHKSYYLLYTGLTHNGKQQTVEPFPNGFQMIAGNNYNRNSTLPNPDPTPLGPWPNESQDMRAQRAIGFNCLHYAAGNDERTLSRHEMPDKAFIDANCQDGIRLELQFPSCWNGQKDGGPTHKSHVAYPDGVITGNCPEGFDKRLVSLFYETIVATDQFKGKGGEFVLANGDPTGYGYHGDFIAAWKDSTLANAVSSCNAQDSTGDMRLCSAFTMTQDSSSCKLEVPLPAAISSENVKGPMPHLPDGMGVYPGPEPAPIPGAKHSGAPAPAAPKGDKSQNVVPSAPLPAVSAPLGSHPAEPMIGQVHEKSAVKDPNSAQTLSAPSQQSSTSAKAEPQHSPAPAAAAPVPSVHKELQVPAPPPSTTPASSAQSAALLKPGERILTTTYYTQGNEVHKVVIVLDEVTVDAPVVVTKTVTAGHSKREHFKKHSHHRHQARMRQ